MASMTHTARLKKQPATFRRLTGITVEAFDTILSKLKPIYEESNRKRLSWKGRIRKIGGGMQFSLPLEDRLLMLLMYYRTYVTHIFLGFIFGIDDSNVGRNINPLQPMLAKLFRIPERRIALTEDEILKLFFDGTEQPTNRPQKKQRKYYSGKKKRHTMKHQVAVVRKRKKTGKGQKKRKVRIAAVSKAFVGKTHDKRMYEETRTLSPPGVEKDADLGYQGTPFLIVPKKKPRGKPLPPRWKRGNRRHSQQRIVVEHGIGKMKIWRMSREQYRNPRHTHTLMFKNIAGLHNLMFA
jgi:hypothetical protein